MAVNPNPFGGHPYGDAPFGPGIEEEEGGGVNCKLVLNDGTSRVLLNDGSSKLLLNDDSCTADPGDARARATAQCMMSGSLGYYAMVSSLHPIGCGIAAT
jgi:hypothetical protein